MLIKNINHIFIFLLLPIINNYSFDSLSVKKHNEFLPVAYYPFNGNANDLSGNNINGEVFGAILSHNLNGDSNKAYYFDGIDDNINIGVKQNIQNLGEFINKFWIEIDSFNGSIQLNTKLSSR
ncbi:MAG: hypothetical protein H6612_15400 [Ignavibacteriales bacterium]|nr:hypothetical protein [Ignavibacteriales bacterium]